MLEAVLHSGRGVEALDILVSQPKELSPIKGYPVAIGEPLGYIVRVGRDQEIFQVLQHLTALSWVLFDFLLFKGIAGYLGFPVCLVAGTALEVHTAQQRIRVKDRHTFTLAG